MRAAGLKAIDTVVDSKAVLIKAKRPSNQKLVELIASRISGVISQYHSSLHTLIAELDILTHLRKRHKNTFFASTTFLALI